MHSYADVLRKNIENKQVAPKNWFYCCGCLCSNIWSVYLTREDFQNALMLQSIFGQDNEKKRVHIEKYTKILEAGGTEISIRVSDLRMSGGSCDCYIQKSCRHDEIKECNNTLSLNYF